MVLLEDFFFGVVFFVFIIGRGEFFYGFSLVWGLVFGNY